MSVAKNLLLMVAILAVLSVVFWFTRERPQALNVVVVGELREPVAQVLEVFSEKASLEVHLEALSFKEALKEAQEGSFDLLWADSPLLAIRLKRLDLLEPYIPPGFDELVAQARDPEGYWFGVAADLKVLLVHRGLDPAPSGIEDLLDKNWPARVALPAPDQPGGKLFWEALGLILGPRTLEEGLIRLKNQGALFLDREGDIARALVSDRAQIGLLGLKEAFVVLQKGGPFRLILPDQGKLSLGAFAVFSTVSLIKDTPALPLARQLLAWLISEEGQRELIRAFEVRLPTRKGLSGPRELKPLSLIDLMPVAWEKLAPR
ncbi:ABC transporter substrate-binding protein [Thermosulfuriphilus sp.]